MWMRGLVIFGLVILPSMAESHLVPFGPDFQVNSHTTGAQNYGVAAIAPDGSFVVVWGSSNDDRGEGVFGQRYDAAGAPVGGEFKVNTLTGFGSRPDVAVSSDGGFVVVWGGQGEDGYADIFARRYDPVGAPLAAGESRMNTYTTGTQQEPSIAIDAAGRTVVVWSAGHYGAVQQGVYGQRLAADGQPLGGEFQVNTTTDSPHHHATVASDAAGNFVVAWEAWDGDLDISARRYDASGVPQGPEFLVSTTFGTQFDAFIASDPAGNFVVVSSSQYSGGFPIFQVAGRRFDPSGTPAGPEFRVNIVTSGYQTSPRPSVAAGAEGGFTVAWQWDENNSGSDVFARQYDSAGIPAGGIFRVNTDTTRHHELPLIASGPDGEFLVTWTARTSPGFDSDIFAQRYRPDLIFADGFESGSLSGWSASATGGGDLSVSADAAAKLTAHGLVAAVDDTAALYVQDASPRDELRYRARFYFDPNGFDPGEAQGRLRTRIFIVFEEAPTRRLAAVVLRRQGGDYSLIGRARLDDGAQADTAAMPIGDSPHFVEIDWSRASGPDSNDGSFDLWIDGALAGTLPNLDNSRSTVDFVRMGALSVKVGAAGALYFDEFDSRRGTYIGP